MEELTIKKTFMQTAGEENKNNKILMYIQGRVTTASSTHLEKNLDEELEKTAVELIILDLSGIEMINSMGIRVILKAYKKAMIMNKKLRIQEPSEAASYVLGLSNLEQLLAK